MSTWENLYECNHNDTCYNYLGVNLILNLYVAVGDCKDLLELSICYHFVFALMLKVVCLSEL